MVDVSVSKYLGTPESISTCAIATFKHCNGSNHRTKTRSKHTTSVGDVFAAHHLQPKLTSIPRYNSNMMQSERKRNVLSSLYTVQKWLNGHEKEPPNSSDLNLTKHSLEAMEP